MIRNLIQLLGLGLVAIASSSCGGGNAANTGTAEEHRVTGTVDFSEAVAAEELIRARITLEDTSIADSSAVVIASTTVAPVDEIPIVFSLPYDPQALDSRYSYSVHAEVFELDSEGQEVRMFMTTQSYPVLTKGFGDRVHLLVERIRSTNRRVAE